MREIFFTKERWRLRGDGGFTGVFHLFKGGRELKGTFASAEAGVNEYRFQALQGSLLWLPQKFEVTNATARVYGGTARFGYLMAPIGTRYAGAGGLRRDVPGRRYRAAGRQPRPPRYPLHGSGDRAHPPRVAARPVLRRASRRRADGGAAACRGTGAGPHRSKRAHERRGAAGEGVGAVRFAPADCARARLARSSPTHSIPSGSRSGPAASRRARRTWSSRGARPGVRTPRSLSTSPAPTGSRATACSRAS